MPQATIRAPRLHSPASRTDKTIRPPNPLQILRAVFLGRKPLQKLLKRPRKGDFRCRLHTKDTTPWGRLSQSATQIWETAPGAHFYGFPDAGTGVKVALHHQGETATPDAVRREVGPDEVTKMRALLDRYMPLANGPLRDSAVCLYTNTPDHHFLIDCHPAHPQVLVASPCSGHGFKFSSVLGEVLADLLITGKTRFDLSLFRLRWR